MNIFNSKNNLIRKTIVVGGLAAVAGGFVAPLAASAGGDVGICGPTTILVHEHNQVVHGTCGPDIIKVGQYTGVTIYAGDGSDDVRGGYGVGGTLTVYLGNGNDEFSNGEQQTLRIYGNAGNDDITGGTKADRLDGGAGKDHFDAHGGGKDTVSGGSQKDVAFLDASDVVTGVEVKEF